MDKELNTAILHLAEKYLPRGFDVVEVGASDENVAEQQRRFEAGESRVLVGNCTDATDTLFGDCEVENNFRALFVSATQQPEVRAGHDHDGICGGIIRNAMILVNDRLVAAYGDDDRTKLWRLKLNIYLVGGIMGRMIGDGRPTMLTVDESVDTAMREDVSPVDALDAMLAAMHYAEVMLAIKASGRDDLEIMPADPRQTAPTTATHQ